MADQQAFRSHGVEEQAAAQYVAREQYGPAMSPHIESAFLQGVHWERDRVQTMQRQKTDDWRRAAESDVGPLLD